MPPTTVLAVRHGQSTWNADGRWQGRADPPLSALGAAQARASVAAIDGVDVVVASDLARARDTAALIADALGAGKVIAMDGLRETDAGPWTGHTKAEIEAKWPGWLASGRRPDGFEAWQDVARRAVAALRDVHARHAGRRVLAVTHAGVIRAVERSLGAEGGVVPNLGGRHIVVDDETLTLGERALLIDAHEVAVTVPTAL